MSDDHQDTTVDHLRDLLQHPGWRVFVQHMQEEWGPSATLDRCRREPIHLMPQVIAVSDALFHALAWPVDEVKRLEDERRRAKAMEQEPLVRRRA